MRGYRQATHKSSKGPLLRDLLPVFLSLFLSGNEHTQKLFLLRAPVASRGVVRTAENAFHRTSSTARSIFLSFLAAKRYGSTRNGIVFERALKKKRPPERGIFNELFLLLLCHKKGLGTISPYCAFLRENP